MLNKFVTQHSDECLIKALRDAAQRKLTPQEKMEQSVSFIYSSVNTKSGITKDRIREILGSTSST
jgi:hypothetical protein